MGKSKVKVKVKPKVKRSGVYKPAAQLNIHLKTRPGNERK
jgi:hypothetical protein